MRLIDKCPYQCSLSREKIGDQAADALRKMREDGAGAILLVRRAEAELGRKVVLATMQRHMTHFRDADLPTEPVVEGPKPSDVTILDEIITAGFRHSKNWRPTIKDTLDAIKLKTQMTGQSAFEDMLNAMNSALDLPDEDEDEPAVVENPDALGIAEERGSEDQEEDV